MSNDPIRVGLVGAGYISTWHADALRATPGVEAAAVVDPSPAAARGLAEALGVPAFGSVAEMLAAGVADSAHILTQPHLHAPLAIECLEGGLHVLVEKPFAPTGKEARAMLAAAERAGRVLGVSHNFLALPAHERLRRLLAEGALGRISSAEVHWHLPLAPLRSGPFGLWLLRERRNLLLELGPHLFAFARDLFGEIEVLAVETGHDIALPGDGPVLPQSWRILARAGGVEVTFLLSTVEVTDDRALVVRGSSGRARLDYAADTLVVARENSLDLVANPLLRALSLAGQHLREGVVNAARQIASLNRRSPYGLSFLNTMRGFYGAIAAGAPDGRFSAEAGCAVIEAIEAALERLPEAPAPAKKRRRRKPDPSAVVIGGTGFIGQHLVRGLVAAGRDVRVLSRGAFGPFGDLPDRVETVAVSLADEAALREAMEGVELVYNLAKSMDKTWEAALRNDVATAERIARAALSAGVGRLIYTGTIASYDMSDPRARITEATGFGEDMEGRNIYARSKAECERRLLRMHREAGLPLSIARPGIVLGRYGPLQHWGIGRWHGAGAVRLWGNGRHILPFVLIDDVVDGLIRMGTQAAALGESFNLVGEPIWSARDYFDAIHAVWGARIRVSTGHMLGFWAADQVKYALKKYALRRAGAIRPSLADWKSRAHYARFDNSRPKRLLGWRPEADEAEFRRRAVEEVDLFGF